MSQFDVKSIYSFTGNVIDLELSNIIRDNTKKDHLDAINNIFGRRPTCMLTGELSQIKDYIGELKEPLRIYISNLISYWTIMILNEIGSDLNEFEEIFSSSIEKLKTYDVLDEEYIDFFADTDNDCVENMIMFIISSEYQRLLATVHRD